VNLYIVDPPTKWQAGTVGEAKTPFYHHCADCYEEKPIAMFLSRDGTYLGMGIIRKDPDDILFRPAMFCADCGSKRFPESSVKANTYDQPESSAR
jgi:hypothetical protein